MERVALAGSQGRLRPPPRAVGPRGSVSVVVPCHNYGRFLAQCVGSALGDDVDVEVLIVDDASTDDSASVARRLSAADSRIRLIEHRRNLGHIRTYNDGLAAATGDYVALVSADDALTPGALARAVHLLDTLPSVGFVYGYPVTFTGAPPVARTRVGGWATWAGTDWLEQRFRTGRNPIRSPEVVIRRSLGEALGWYDERLPHTADLALWLLAGARADVGRVVGPDQAYYRMHDHNLHRAVFGMAEARGAVYDIAARWACFEIVLGRLGPEFDVEGLRAAAAGALARDALRCANEAAASEADRQVVAELRSLARLLDRNARPPHLVRQRQAVARWRWRWAGL
jgi:glycosyltransferase involved in cell wall biosynthesis